MKMNAMELLVKKEYELLNAEYNFSFHDKKYLVPFRKFIFISRT